MCKLKKRLFFEQNLCRETIFFPEFIRFLKEYGLILQRFNKAPNVLFVYRLGIGDFGWDYIHDHSAHFINCSSEETG